MPHETNRWIPILLGRIVTECSPLSKLSCLRSNDLITGVKTNEANLLHILPSLQMRATWSPNRVAFERSVGAARAPASPVAFA